MPASQDDRAASHDKSASRKEDVADGHQRAADSAPHLSDLHDKAAARFRRAAAEDRSRARIADEQDAQERD